VTSPLGRIRLALDRPRLWRVTAILAALVLCVLLVAAAQGSMEVVSRHASPASAPRAPSWERWCGAGAVREDRLRLAYCARVDGIVLASTHGPSPVEHHVAVIGDFHLTIVRLPDRMPAPGVGTRLVAVGPLVRARDGQREVQAFRVLRG
jgi:hypothetical protein